MQERLISDDNPRARTVAWLISLYLEAFPGKGREDMSLDFFEAGVLDREEAEALSGFRKKGEFSQALVARRRARRGARASQTRPAPPPQD